MDREGQRGLVQGGRQDSTYFHAVTSERRRGLIMDSIRVGHTSVNSESDIAKAVIGYYETPF